MFTGEIGVPTEELFQRHKISHRIPRRLCANLVSAFKFNNAIFSLKKNEQCEHLSKLPVCSGFSILNRHDISYPSGHLAVVVMVTGENRRICIVYEDDSGPHQIIRAMFHSDGRGTCYYSNGTVW